MTEVFLIGGGWRTETFHQTYGRFLKAATRNGQKRIAIIVAEEENVDSQNHFFRFLQAFQAIGLNSADAISFIISAENPLTREKLAETESTGVFVCGGLTPVYHDALCRDKSWLAYLTENNIPYCGFSAGASIAAERAIMGGWQRKITDQTIEVTGENAGEDLTLLDVRNGLGLIPFAVDIHATQWGTLTRLMHAIDAGLAPEGWAIDENTMLEINRNGIFVHGAGSVYRIRTRKKQLEVEIFQSGIHLPATNCKS